jgi:acyl-CoA reductase-like NAD-dependent aldehyde dehydrogenase
VQRAIATFIFSAEEAVRNVGEVVGVDLSEAHRSMRGWYERFPLGPIAAITPYRETGGGSRD